jgi:hypothetical protein
MRFYPPNPSKNELDALARTLTSKFGVEEFRVGRDIENKKIPTVINCKIRNKKAYCVVKRVGRNKQTSRVYLGV